jgi:uncharacterized protein (DUF488 family)
MVKFERISVGYEGRNIENFVSALQHAEVEILVDVRLTPLSRKRGFSKTSLTEALADVGIRYVHLKALGNPRENREAFHTGDLRTGRSRFRKMLKQDAAQLALADLSDLVEEHRVGVLCFEADIEKCHRYEIIQALTRRLPGLEPSFV